MNMLKHTCALCLAFLICGPPTVSAEDQGYDSLGRGNILAEEVSSREQLALEISSKHAVARLEADEFMQQHKYGWARHIVREAQKRLLARRNQVPSSVFTLLNTRGQEKLNEIDAREIYYLRQRLAGERPSCGKPRKPEAAELPTPETNESLGVTVTGPGAHAETRTVTYVRGPLRKGLQALIGSVDYQDDSLSEVLDDLREKSGANIVANWQSLSSAGIDKNTPVSLKLKNVSAGRILKAVAQNLSNSWSPVSYVEHGGIVIIATAKDLARIIDTRVYDIMHLLMETKDLRGGARYDSNRTSRRNSSGSRYDRDGSAGTDRTQKIVDIVRSSASEDSWRENGGPGGVAVFGTRLVVTQTAGNHAKIAMALTQLGW